MRATLLEAYRLAGRVVLADDEKACAYPAAHAHYDGWKRAFQVACKMQVDGLVIRSAGKDGNFRTPDDIVWIANPGDIFSPDIGTFR